MISIFQEEKRKYPIYFLNHLFIHFEFISFFFIHTTSIHEFTLQKMKIPIIFHTFFIYVIKKWVVLGEFFLLRKWFEERRSFIYILSYKTCTLSHTYRRNGWMPISAGINIFTMSFHVIFGLQSVF